MTHQEILARLDERFENHEIPEEEYAKQILSRIEKIIWATEPQIHLELLKIERARIPKGRVLKEERGKYSIKKDQLQLKTTGGDIVKFPFVYEHEDTLKLEMKENEYIVYYRSLKVEEEDLPAEKNDSDFLPVDLDLLLDHQWNFQKMVKARKDKDPVIASGPFFKDDYISFKKEGIFEGIRLQSEELGTWALEEEGRKLVKTLSDGTTTFWYVVKLNEEELILNKGTDDHKWYYLRGIGKR